MKFPYFEGSDPYLFSSALFRRTLGKIYGEVKKRKKPMGILNEFQLYIKKQSVKNKNGKCGLSIYEAKKSKKVKYWINYQ